MRKVYTLPAITVDGQDTSIGIDIADDAKLRSWLCAVKNHIVVPKFSFYWSQDPRAPRFYLLGSFLTAHRMDGIYVKLQLCYEDYYRDALYPIGDLWRMLYEIERPSFGLCVTVKVC
jgi:hypothetical protein